MKFILRPILPQLPPTEFDALVESIREHGVRCPLHVTPVKGKPDNLLIVDGHERYRAAEVAGVRLKNIPFLIVGNLDDAVRVRMAVSLNAHRRHLTSRQRRDLLERYFLSDPRSSIREAADHCQTSTATAARVKRRVQGVSGETPATRGRDGKTYRHPMTFARYPHGLNELASLMDRIGDELPDGVNSPRRLRKTARRKEIDKARFNPLAQLPPEFRIEHCDFRDLEARTGDLTGKVQVLLTDPPWVDDYDDLLKPFSEFAARVLASNGVLLCYSGWNSLPHFLDALREQLTYQWNIVCLNSPKLHKGAKLAFRGWNCGNGMLRICHRNVLVFSKSRVWKPYKFPDDVIAENEPRVTLHPKGWNQPVSESVRLLSWFARPGSLVVDCFSGTGTSLLACARVGQGFRAIACDTDLTCVKIARKRVKDQLKAITANISVIV